MSVTNAKVGGAPGPASLLTRCSLAYWLNVSIASRKVPALRTCSQVRVVRDVQSGVMGVLTGLTRTLWW